VAESLGYADPKKAIRTHVWKKNRATVVELYKGDKSPPFSRGHPDTVLLYEPGLYQLVCSSRLTIAEVFQDWVFRDILPSIRKTGSYELPEPKPLDGNQLKLLNETDPIMQSLGTYVIITQTL
jgi:prophage antirepressor-like protein